MKRLLPCIAITLLMLAKPAYSQPSSGQPFSVEVVGHGSPILLIPGLSSSGATFDEVVKHLSARYECHVLTLAGFAGVPAETDIAEGKMLEAVEDGVSRYIQHHALVHPVLIGHSLGGFIALEFAERYPGLAGDLVIVDALPFAAGVMLPGQDAAAVNKAAAQMKHYIADETQDAYVAYIKSGLSTRPLVSSDADAKKLIVWGIGSDKQVVGEAMYEMLVSDARPKLPDIKGRVLVLGTWVSYPGSTKESVYKTFAEQFNGTKRLQITMADREHHFIMLDNPPWFNAEVDVFLADSAEHAAK